jgi:hypothetical protein
MLKVVRARGNIYLTLKELRTKLLDSDNKFLKFACKYLANKSLANRVIL